jgi:rhodanese-related sulfurtransferase
MPRQSGRDRRSLRQLVDAARQVVPEIAPAQARTYLEQGGVDLILDVRERDEWDDGHIPGALHAPRGLLEWFADQDSGRARGEMTLLCGNAVACIVVYCADGGRALLAGHILCQMGYANVWSIEGGYNAWTAQGLPVE